MGVVKYSGPVASFHCPTNAEIRSLKVHFSPKQLGEGDPSPENVRDIDGINYITIFSKGTSIVDFTDRAVIRWYVPENFLEKEVIYWGLIDNTLGTTTVKLSLRLRDANNVSLGTYYSTQTVAPGECKNIWAIFKITTQTNSIQFSVSNATSNTIIKERGLWLYNSEDHVTIDFDSFMYGGYVDLITGELVQNYEMITINSTQEWQMKLIQNHSAAQLNLSTLTENTKKTDTYGMFNYVKYMIDTSQLIDWNGRIANTGLMTIFIPSDINTRDDMNNYIVQHPLQVCYELATPITHQLTPIQLQTFLGQNNVWSNADYVEVEYDLHETQNILARKQFIIANQPHVEKLAAAPLQSFETDMAAPLKECKVYFSPIQDTSNGVPSPDNICPISGWTGLEVYRTGKNLCSRPEGGGDYMPLLIPIGTYVTASSNIGGNVTLQSSVDGSFIRYSQVSKDGNRKYEVTFDVPENKDTYRFNRQSAGQNCQLELGSIATEYEPYAGTTIPITFPSEAGTIYGGYADLVRGELVQEYASLDLAELTWSSWGDGNYRSNRITGMLSFSWVAYPNGSLLAEKYSIVRPYDIQYKNAVGIGLYENTVCSSFVDPTGLIVYKLATPATYSLDPITLKTLRGTNNIWTSNGGDNIEIAYWKH